MAEPSANVNRVVVIGGGLSGLVAAHRISVRGRDHRRPVEVVVLEARDRVGGAIWTDRRDGFTLEGGATPSSRTSRRPSTSAGPWGWGTGSSAPTRRTGARSSSGRGG